TTGPDYKFTFPPFPAPPPGVNIIPFKDFKPSGIRIPIDGDDFEQERDGLGIPTVELLVKHSTDNLEKKRRKKKPGAPQVTVDQGKPKTWWEQWDELEDVRKKYYDPNLSRVDRVFQAGADFRGGRPWPQGATGHALQNLWDQFRTYVGLLHNPIINRKKQDQISDDSDDEAGPKAPAPAPVHVVQQPAPPPPTKAETDNPAYLKRRKRPFRPMGSAYDEPDEAEAEEGLSWDEKLQNRREEKDIRMDNFLNDPERSMRIFFSSYFRDRGLIWSEPRCLAMPTLVSYFLRYLLRSRVLPEPEHEKPLRRACEIAEKARFELPLTHAIGKAVTDEFHDACRHCWGTRKPPFDWGDSGIFASQKDEDKDANEDEDAAEPGTKRQKTDVDSAPLDAAVKAAVASVVSNAAEFQPILLDKNTVPESVAAGGWGEPGSGSWGDATAWGADADDAPAAGTEGTGWGDAANTATPVAWNADWGDGDGNGESAEEMAAWNRPPPTLVGLLGPTALPLTHEPGVVEWSTRRVVSLHPPLPPRLPGSGADAVEEALERHFGRVVFAPWPGWDKHEKSDIRKPVIPNTSKGAVVAEEDAEREVEAKGGVRPHNPFKDEITVLVMPEIVDLLSVGMGLGAYWIEIVRQEGVSSGSKKGKKKERPRYWYIEQVMHIMPSYYEEA
ncbi:hypothetical protein EVG20_g3757, partial [Dentipellis fragilis]